jgi:pyroglutamyl-peptidase
MRAGKDAPPARSILLTGFEPFGGSGVNASWEVAQALDGCAAGPASIVAAQLPTVFGASARCLQTLVRQLQPALVVCLGQAGGRRAVSIERVAINVNDACIADNAGCQPVDTSVVAGGPAAYFSTLPIKQMLSALLRAGLPAEISQTAGTFVCNHVFYALMHTLATSRDLQAVRAGFIHLPWLPEQGDPCLNLETMVRGVGLAIAAAMEPVQEDVPSGGALH